MTRGAVVAASRAGWRAARAARVVAAIAGAALSVAMATASPSSALTVLEPPASGGPLLVGGAPWLFTDRGAIELRAGGSILRATFPGIRAAGTFSSQAAADRVVRYECSSGCGTQYEQGFFPVDALVAGTAGQPARCVAGSDGSTPCQTAPGCAGQLVPPSGTLEGGVGSRFTVDGTRLAYEDGCGGVTVLDLSGSTPVVSFGEVSLLALKGRYLASLSTGRPPDAVQLLVYDLTRGAPVLSHKLAAGRRLGPAAVQADGAAAWSELGRNAAGSLVSRIYEQPSGARAPRLLTAVPGALEDLRFAGGRVAVLRVAGPQTGLVAEVLDATGHVVRATQTEIGWDFDGTNLATTLVDCAVSLIQSGPISGPPPSLPPTACAAPVPRGRARLMYGDALAISLHCPRQATLGCAGAASATLRSAACRPDRPCPAIGRIAGSVPAVIEPGFATVIYVYPNAKAVAWLRNRRHRGILRLTLHAPRDPGQRPPAQRLSVSLPVAV